MRSLVRGSLVSVVSLLLGGQVALGAVESKIYYNEAWYPVVTHDGNLEYYENSIVSDKAIRLNYPVAGLSSANNRAYVDPIARKVGAKSVADTSGIVIAVPGGLDMEWHSTNRKIVETNATFTDTLTVSSDTLAPKTPVRLKVTLRVDGRAETSNPKGDPGSTTVSAEGSAGFAITDPTLTVINEETGWERPAGPIAKLTASAEALQETARPNPANPYAINGTWWRQFESSWEASSNTGQDLGDFEQDSVEMSYPETDIVEIGGGYRKGITVDTGYVTLFFDTYVGAELEIAGGVYTSAYASHYSARGTADFLHTMGFEFGVADESAGMDLSLTLASTTVPEPGTGVLLAACGLLLGGRRRRA